MSVRKVLLVEPKYRNKYPPMGLMKLATYFRRRGDDVRFFKGDLKDHVAELMCERFINEITKIDDTRNWKYQFTEFCCYIRKGSNKEILNKYEQSIIEKLNEYRLNFKRGKYFDEPPYDFVGITTLFTFHWAVTIDTINFAKQICKNKDRVMVGGIAATLVDKEIEKETGIVPFRGQLSVAGTIDRGDPMIIDELPLDYSILHEVDYKYPASDAYFAYMTRGCCNKCTFCAVPKLEPEFKEYIALKDSIKTISESFGEQKNLLLLDNNVLASSCFNKIIDEIKECGFAKGATFIPPNRYEIAIKNLKKGYNDRAYIRLCVELYKTLCNNLEKEKKDELLAQVKESIKKTECDTIYTATKDNILQLDEQLAPIFKTQYRGKPLKRIIDFNQGVEAKKVTDETMKKLAETNIEPLRIAFDHWSINKIYEKAVRTAVRNGITNLSNYLLYNHKDKPEELYYRMRMNVDLCEELDVSIYSFPMKYHPIDDPRWFRNRNYIGENWTRKYIRAIQAVLNSTKGKIGKGLTFFNCAFGKDVDEFRKILYMPEAFIIYRNESIKNGNTEKWWNAFCSLSEEKREKLIKIIGKNDFKNISALTDDKEILGVLKYYTISRTTAHNGKQKEKTWKK